jgi:hypothetical protein
MGLERLCGYVFFAMISVSSIGCGGLEDPLGVATSVHAADPSCGTSCPDDCWVDITGTTGSRVATLFIFDADSRNETAMRDGYLLLSHPTDQWPKDLIESVPDPVPDVLEAGFGIPGTFNDAASGLEIKVIMDGIEPDLSCGFERF